MVSAFETIFSKPETMVLVVEKIVFVTEKIVFGASQEAETRFPHARGDGPLCLY